MTESAAEPIPKPSPATEPFEAGLDDHHLRRIVELVLTERTAKKGDRLLIQELSSEGVPEDRVDEIIGEVRSGFQAAIATTVEQMQSGRSLFFRRAFRDSLDGWFDVSLEALPRRLQRFKNVALLVVIFAIALKIWHVFSSSQ